MPRDVRAYLVDILESREAIETAIVKRDLPLLRAECLALVVEIEQTARVDG